MSTSIGATTVHERFVRFVCSPCLSRCARERQRRRGRGRKKKGCAVSDGVEPRSFEIRRALRDGGTRATVPCFRTARHSARLGHGGVTSSSRYAALAARRRRRPRTAERPRGATVRKGGVKIARDEFVAFEVRDRDTTERGKEILTRRGHETAADRRLPANATRRDDNAAAD